jgi:hypothetical protein
VAQRTINQNFTNGSQHAISFALPFTLTTVIASTLIINHLTTTQLHSISSTYDVFRHAPPHPYISHVHACHTQTHFTRSFCRDIPSRA